MALDMEKVKVTSRDEKVKQVKPKKKSTKERKVAKCSNTQEFKKKNFYVQL